MVQTSCDDACASVEVFQRNGTQWVASEFSARAFKQKIFSARGVIIIFAQADSIRECVTCRAHFEKKFQIPELWWYPWCRRANGYFGTEENLDDEGNIIVHNSWLRFIIKRFLAEPDPKEQKRYVWSKFNIFTNWIAQTQTTFVLVFDPREEVKDMIAGKHQASGSIQETQKSSQEDINMVSIQKKAKASDLIKRTTPARVVTSNSLPPPAAGFRVFRTPKGIGPACLLDRLTHSRLEDPYSIHVLFMQDVVSHQDESVWRFRDLLRDVEIQRPSAKDLNLEDKYYEQIHNVARHAIHVSETLDAAVATIASIRSEHDAFLERQAFQNNQSPGARRIFAAGEQVRKDLAFADSMLRNLRCRASSNLARIKNEIQLAFNIVAQYDSGVSIRIGEAAMQDSAAMKTIAILTLIFLPATFLSSIFSMSFFNYDPDANKWRMHKYFWIYWVITVPVTAVTVLAWLLWHKFKKPPQVGKPSVEPGPVQKKKDDMKRLVEKWIP